MLLAAGLRTSKLDGKSRGDTPTPIGQQQTTQLKLLQQLLPMLHMEWRCTTGPRAHGGGVTNPSNTAVWTDPASPRTHLFRESTNPNVHHQEGHQRSRTGSNRTPGSVPATTEQPPAWGLLGQPQVGHAPLKHGLGGHHCTPAGAGGPACLCRQQGPPGRAQVRTAAAAGLQHCLDLHSCCAPGPACCALGSNAVALTCRQHASAAPCVEALLHAAFDPLTASQQTEMVNTTKRGHRRLFLTTELTQRIRRATKGSKGVSLSCQCGW